jgi:hypothetical protein
MTETAQGKVNDKKTAVFHRKEYHPRKGTMVLFGIKQRK